MNVVTAFATSLLLLVPAANAGYSDDYAYAKGLQICLLAFGRNENAANAALEHFNKIYSPTIF